MDTVINNFISLLRQHNVRISPAESIDALQALQYVGLGEREVVRDSLRATLIKSTDDIAVFDRLFDLYFGLHSAVARPSRSLRIADHD
ncbi:MAG: VWA containing CoxE family protein, partial [Chloroflexota bacterium]|nr:VWA containing CoxE family protein [Chloroflexota bacterium]